MLVQDLTKLKYKLGPNHLLKVKTYLNYKGSMTQNSYRTNKKNKNKGNKRKSIKNKRNKKKIDKEVKIDKDLDQ